MKNKSYLWLYYICFVLTLLIIGVGSIKFTPTLTLSENVNLFDGLIDYINASYSISLLSLINFAFFLIFIILIIKKRKLNVNSLIFPVSYIIFFLVLNIICFLFNNKVIMPYIHFGYYQTFILIDYLFLNIYSLLCLTKKEE